MLESPTATAALIVCVLLDPRAAGIGDRAAGPFDLAQLSILDARLPPGSEGSDGFRYWLGSDDQGRDMLSAMLYGLRISLAVGVVSGVFALIVGTSLGLIAAYFGGWIDAFLMRLVDLMLGFPAILVAMMLLAVLGQGGARWFLHWCLCNGPILPVPSAAAR